MNRDDKIRDLIHRLAGMSPQPPPFPEESPMAKPSAKSKPRPILMFAAGAAIVAAVLVPLLFLDGSGPPVAASSTTTTSVPSSSTTIATSTTIPATTSTTAGTTTTVPVATTWSGGVFLYQMPEDSFVENPAMVPISLVMTDNSGEVLENDYFTEALAALGSELPELPADSRLVNAVPASVQIVDLSTATIDGTGVWTADMNEAFLAGAGGLLADYTMLNQLIYTITWGEGSDVGVLFTVAGEPVTAFGSEGLDLSAPVDRDTFIEELALIFLTEPLVPLEGVYTVTGRANAFEASLWVQVIDGDGDVIHEEYAMATCGTGCWGDFTVDIDAALIVGGETSIRLLTYSAEDGSAQNVLTVPIPANGVWTMTVG